MIANHQIEFISVLLQHFIKERTADYATVSMHRDPECIEVKAYRESIEDITKTLPIYYESLIIPKLESAIKQIL